jgi:hypothetical protein
MIVLLLIILYIICLVIGYTIGRASHVWWGSAFASPHHWIYGCLLFFIGSWIHWGWLASFGVGLWISDGADFWNCKWYGTDDTTSTPNFWGVD